MHSADPLQLREIWEAVVTEDRGLAAIVWSPHTFHLSLWIVPAEPDAGEAGRQRVYRTGLPIKIVERWQEYGLPTLSVECLDKLSALEAARGGARG